MKYTKLGDTDLEVSVISMGCWGISGGEMWGKQNEEDAIAAIQKAYENGINFFDTAEGYGNGYSEELLGEALDGFRKEIKIASKVKAAHLRPKDLKESCENSLQRLNTDYLDLYYIHWPNPDILISDTIKALEELKKEGKIRYYGTSNFGIRQMKGFLQHTELNINQLPYNLLWRSIEHEIKPFCREKDIGLAVYSPLLHGLLTGKFGSPDLVPEGRARTRHFSRERPETRHREEGVEEETFDTIEKIELICREFGVDMTQTSIAWPLTQSGIDTVIAGARSPEHVKENAQAGELDLPKELISKLDKATRDLKGSLGNNPDLWQDGNESRIR